jgi:hypothetical protein
VSDEVLKLVPFGDSVGVQIHVDKDGDVISETFIDRITGRRVMVLRDPSTALQLGRDLVKACTDPYVAAAADGVRGAQP